MTPKQMLFALGFIAAAACSVIASGCAVTAVDCGADWYAIGAREGS